MNTAKPTLQNKKTLAGILLVCAVFFSSLLALQNGPIAMSSSELWLALWNDNATSNHAILFDIRLPRILMSLLVGAGLAVSGAVMQGLFRNPLADPGLVGVSAGAALGAGLAIVLGGWLFVEVPMWLLPLNAFIFGLAVTWIVYLIANNRQGTQVATLLLAGVAMQAFAGAAMGLLSYLANDQQLRDLTFWNLGSFGASAWNNFYICALVSIPALFALLSFSKHLNAMLLGEAEAEHLGISVENVKRISIVLVSLIVGTSVASVGAIGFVGLVVPHVVRLAFGSDHKFLLPASAGLGALLLVVADTFARTIISPAELPIGILTALIGCPFFIFLILKQRNLII